MEGFEVKVPITLKGGQEGNKVGKQIGEKIAAQLNKSFKAVGIGGTQTGVGGAAGMLGVSKDLKGVAVKLGIIGLAIGATVAFLKKSSPYLKGILDIFGRAFMIFFRPFGDFLATLLRPMAILMMKMAVAFLRWTGKIRGIAREGKEGAPQIPTTGIGGVDFATSIANWFLRIGGAIGALSLAIIEGAINVGKGLVDLGSKMAEWIHLHVIIPAGEFLAEKLFGIWNWTEDFAGWLWTQITNIWIWTEDFAAWVWKQITNIWSWDFDFGNWIEEKLKSIWTWNWNFGDWFKNKIINALDPTPGNILSKYILGGGQVGISNVPREGLYHLHPGEEVVPRTKVGQRSVILKPTFNFSGNITQDIDIDSIVRRAGRQTEMDLKQRGII